MPTHEVTNQVPPLVGHDTSQDPALRAALEREGAGWALPEVEALGRLAGTAEAQEWGRRAEANPPVLTTPRPLGQPGRRGRVRPGVPRADANRCRPRAPRDALGRPARRRPRRPRREVHDLERRRRARLPGLDDLRRGAGAADGARPGADLRAAAHLHHLRPRPPRADHQGRAHRGHVDDREAGRVRRPRQHHAGGAAARRQLPAHRPQVVHLGADERPVPRPGPGAGRAVVLPGAAGAARTASATRCT